MTTPPSEESTPGDPHEDPATDLSSPAAPSEQGTPAAGGNQALLAGLNPGNPTPPRAPDPGPGGPLPWDRKATTTPPGNTVHAAGAFDQTASSATNTSTGVAAAGAVAPAGAYPGTQPGEMRYWNGTSWDPRPIAPVWTRIWCWIIDNLLASVAAIAVGVILGLPANIAFGPDAAVTIGCTAIGFLVGFVGYFALGYAVWGRTPGMMLGRLDVIRIDSGAKLTWGQALMRAFILTLGQACGILAVIWVAITAGSASKQGPHDSAARSLVLRRPR